MANETEITSFNSLSGTFVPDPVPDPPSASYSKSGYLEMPKLATSKSLELNTVIITFWDLDLSNCSGGTKFLLFLVVGRGREGDNFWSKLWFLSGKFPKNWRVCVYFTPHLVRSLF